MQLKYLHIYGTLLVTLWLGLFLDSHQFSGYVANNQLITNILVILVFLWIYSRVSKITRKLMIIGVFASYAGEVTLSVGLGMYTYRLGNVPLYVPFGHAIVYAGVYYITREGWVRRNRQQIEAVLYPLMIIYATAWLLLAGDLLGFLSTMVIVLLFRRHPETRLFFLFMYFMVVYLELIGTHYQCWFWPTTWFDLFDWMPSANPPSGIGVFYFAFDGLCLLCYKYLDVSRWRRVRAVQRLRLHR